MNLVSLNVLVAHNTASKLVHLICLTAWLFNIIAKVVHTLYDKLVAQHKSTLSRTQTHTSLIYGLLAAMSRHRNNSSCGFRVCCFMSGTINESTVFQMKDISNDCLVFHMIVWYFIWLVFHLSGISYDCLVFHMIVWYFIWLSDISNDCLVFQTIAWYFIWLFGISNDCLVFHLIVWYFIWLSGIS